jgi:hypothetical protein
VTLRQLSALVVVLAGALLLSSCAAIEGIFKAGVWVGALMVVIVVVALITLFTRIRT